MKLKDLKKFIAAVEKKHGKKADNFKLETFHPFLIDGEKAPFRRPQEIDVLQVGKYEKDKNHTIFIAGGC